jgi:hypothetical protein
LFDTSGMSTAVSGRKRAGRASASNSYGASKMWAVTARE